MAAELVGLADPGRLEEGDGAGDGDVLALGDGDGVVGGGLGAGTPGADGDGAGERLWLGCVLAGVGESVCRSGEGAGLVNGVTPPAGADAGRTHR